MPVIVAPFFFCHRQSISSRVQKSKANVEAIQALMGKFSSRAFITRKSRDSTLLVFADIEESVSKQHALITSTGEQIHKLLQVYSSYNLHAGEMLCIANVNTTDIHVYVYLVFKLFIQHIIFRRTSLSSV